MRLSPEKACEAEHSGRWGYYLLNPVCYLKKIRTIGSETNEKGLQSFTGVLF